MVRGSASTSLPIHREPDSTSPARGLEGKGAQAAGDSHLGLLGWGQDSGDPMDVWGCPGDAEGEGGPLVGKLV